MRSVFPFVFCFASAAALCACGRVGYEPSDAAVAARDLTFYRPDLSVHDAGVDAAQMDATIADAGVDLGAIDMGADDLGAADLGVDLGPADLGTPDLGPADMGVDLGPDDMGTPDLGPVDMGVIDMGPTRYVLYVSDDLTGDLVTEYMDLATGAVSVAPVSSAVAAITPGACTRPAANNCILDIAASPATNYLVTWVSAGPLTSHYIEPDGTLAAAPVHSINAGTAHRPGEIVFDPMDPAHQRLLVSADCGGTANSSQLTLDSSGVLAWDPACGGTRASCCFGTVGAPVGIVFDTFVPLLFHVGNAIDSYAVDETTGALTHHASVNIYAWNDGFSSVVSLMGSSPPSGATQNYRNLAEVQMDHVNHDLYVADSANSVVISMYAGQIETMDPVVDPGPGGHYADGPPGTNRIVMHPTAERLYASGEMSGAVYSYIVGDIDGHFNGLTLVCTTSGCPALQPTIESIRVTPDGLWLVATSPGDEAIYVVPLDPTTGVFTSSFTRYPVTDGTNPIAPGALTITYGYSP